MRPGSRKPKTRDETETDQRPQLRLGEDECADPSMRLAMFQRMNFNGWNERCGTVDQSDVIFQLASDSNCRHLVFAS